VVELTQSALDSLGLKPAWQDMSLSESPSVWGAVSRSLEKVAWSPPRTELAHQPITLAVLIAGARAVEWDFTNWCYASGYDASDPNARRMFECLLTQGARVAPA
jgi:hypothetical protein